MNLTLQRLAVRRSIPMMGKRAFSSSAGNDLELVKLQQKHRLDMAQSIGSTVCYLGFFGTIAGLAWINRTQVKEPKPLTFQQTEHTAGGEIVTTRTVGK